MKKNRSLAAVLLIICISACAVFFGCSEAAEPAGEAEPKKPALPPEVSSGKVYAAELLDEERDSITVGKLSKDHIYYEEVIGIDPECADYIEEISIYDKEIDDTFVVHVSLPPEYDENEEYPMVLMTDGVWRLSDHPELRPLMKDGEIEPVILVSIGYPNDYDYEDIRCRDLVDEPDSFLHFIVDNLVPYLLEAYPASSENMTLAGHSLGGYWGYYALFHNDTIGKNTFKNFFIGSPSIVEAKSYFMNMNYFEERFFQRGGKLDCNVYVTVGSEEEDWFIGASDRFIELLQGRNYEGLVLTSETIEGHVHETVFKPSIKNTLEMYYGK